MYSQNIQIYRQDKVFRRRKKFGTNNNNSNSAIIIIVSEQERLDYYMSCFCIGLIENKNACLTYTGYFGDLTIDL